MSVKRQHRVVPVASEETLDTQEGGAAVSQGRDNIVGGLEAHHVHYTYARDIRGSDNRTSELVKRGGFLEKDSEIFA